MSIGTPDPTAGTYRQALEQLSFFYAVGALILFLAAAALGRLSVHSLRDVALAERRAAQADTASVSGPTAAATTPMPTADTETAHPVAPQREPTTSPPATSNELP